MLKRVDRTTVYGVFGWCDSPDDIRRRTSDAESRLLISIRKYAIKVMRVIERDLKCDNAAELEREIRNLSRITGMSFEMIRRAWSRFFIQHEFNGR